MVVLVVFFFFFPSRWAKKTRLRFLEGKNRRKNNVSICHVAFADVLAECGMCHREAALASVEGC